MKTLQDLEVLKAKEPQIEWLDDKESENKSPIHKKMVRTAETAQVYTAWDLYLSRAEIDKELTGLTADLEPKNWKLKMKTWKETFDGKLEKLKHARELVDTEIKQIERDFDIETIEREYQLAIQKKLQEEEAEKAEAEANQSTEWVQST